MKTIEAKLPIGICVMCKREMRVNKLYEGVFCKRCYNIVEKVRPYIFDDDWNKAHPFGVVVWSGGAAGNK